VGDYRPISNADELGQLLESEEDGLHEVGPGSVIRQALSGG
jgi:hypothetical protein